jgi:GTP-binding protein
MSLPTVAIIGRPNVGKSTLFNRLVGRRVALVDDRPGVTRDRREGEGRLLDLKFRVMDTAGFEDEDPTSLPGRMRAQTEAAVREADVALFLIDAREGLTPLDEEIARWLRAQDVPVVLVANKAEGRSGCRPSMARGWSTCSRRSARMSSTSIS